MAGSQVAPLSNVLPEPPRGVDQFQRWLDEHSDNGADVVHVDKVGSNTYAIEIDGEVEYVNAEELKKLKFDLKGGKDTLVVAENVDVAITANLGGDDDRAWFNANDNVNGGSGRNQLNGRGGNGGTSNGAAEEPTSATPPPTTATARPTPAAVTPPATTPSIPAMASPVSGNGNYVFANNSGTINFSTTPMSSNFDLGAAVNNSNSGLTQTSPGVYVGSLSGVTATVTQPQGAGGPMNIKLTVPDGVLKGATIDLKLNADNSASVKINGGSLSSTERKSLEDLINKQLRDGTDNAFSSVKKKKGGGSATTGADAAAGGGAAAGAPDGGGSIDGASGLDGTSGLDTNVSDGSDSWFMVLAVAMGTIMNKMAEKMIGLLNKIKAAGDDPPYALTAEFQATAQMLSFMQQAFMTALNSLGESIKTSVTAGGAAR
jgi:hypothetical protein